MSYANRGLSYSLRISGSRDAGIVFLEGESINRENSSIFIMYSYDPV